MALATEVIVYGGVMKVCGVDIKGSEAFLAVVELDQEDISHAQLETRKIALQDDDQSDNVKSFFAVIDGFVRDNHITHVAIRKRSKAGNYAGGPTTFKIEGIVQLLGSCDVTLLSPQTISAMNKKHGFDLPDSLFKYQHDAFLTACTAIAKAKK